MHVQKNFAKVVPILLAGAVLATIAVGCSDTPTRPSLRTLSPQAPNRWTYQGNQNMLCKYGPAGTGPYFFAIWTEGYGKLLVPAMSVTAEKGGYTYVISVPVNTCIAFYQNLTSYNESVNIVEINLPAGTSFDHATCTVGPFADNNFHTTDCPWANSTVNNLHVEPLVWGPVTVSVYNKGPTVGFQGCTPGFWKNSPGSWPPTGYATTDLYNTIFGVSAFSSNPTLMQALSTGGGGAIALGRASTAALLAAAHPNVNYPLTTSQIITLVQAAFASGGNIASTATLLDGYNNASCPLANDNSWLK